MNKIPTAEEFSKNYSRLRSAMALKDLSEFAIEFTKLHVENCKKEYYKIILQEGLITETGIAYLENAYPLENIK